MISLCRIIRFFPGKADIGFSRFFVLEKYCRLKWFCTLSGVWTMVRLLCQYIETVMLTESAKSFLKIFLDFVAFSPVFDIFGTWHLLYYHCPNIYQMVRCICITRSIKMMFWNTFVKRALCVLLFPNGIFRCICVRLTSFG